METIEWDSPASELAIKQFEIAAERLNLDHNIARRLKQPDRALIVSVPTRMDNGEVRMFAGYRVQYNDVLDLSKVDCAIIRGSIWERSLHCPCG